MTSYAFTDVSTTMTRAIIADDHPLFRAALKQALSETLESDIKEAASFEQLESMLLELPHIELVLLDLSMPGNKGLTGLTSLRNQFPNVLVVIVSANEQVPVIRQAMAFGASAYIPKSVPLPELKHAIEAVLAGDTWLPDDLRDVVAANSEPQTDDFARRLELLTPQQFKVLQCLADGMLNKQIAYDMNVQETTIKQHVSAILRKLEVINRTQAGVVFRQMLSTPEID